jgi:hypothetical protein
LTAEFMKFICALLDKLYLSNMRFNQIP